MFKKHLQDYTTIFTEKKMVYKWTHAVATHVVQGSIYSLNERSDSLLVLKGEKGDFLIFFLSLN